MHNVSHMKYFEILLAIQDSITRIDHHNCIGKVSTKSEDICKYVYRNYAIFSIGIWYRYSIYIIFIVKLFVQFVFVR